MPKFTAHNTRGYSQVQLDELNRLFDAEIAKVHCCRDRKALCDYIADMVEFNFSRSIR